MEVRFEANTGNTEGAYHDGFNEIVLRAGLKLKPEKLKDTLTPKDMQTAWERETGICMSYMRMQQIR